ncbi:MAG: hypothetical protein ABIV47_02525 [Roseiflexaceae bacterium]
MLNDFKLHCQLPILLLAAVLSGTGLGKVFWVPASSAPALELAGDLSLNNLHWRP